MANQRPDEDAIFQRARALGDLQQRSAYIDQACEGDQTLRERVEALLRMPVEERQFMPTMSPAELAAAASVDSEKTRLTPLP